MIIYNKCDVELRYFEKCCEQCCPVASVRLHWMVQFTSNVITCFMYQLFFSFNKGKYISFESFVSLIL